MRIHPDGACGDIVRLPVRHIREGAWRRAVAVFVIEKVFEKFLVGPLFRLHAQNQVIVIYITVAPQPVSAVLGCLKHMGFTLGAKQV
ncbi:MAG: hypothetical protein BWY09_03202 [Candidatus Hydrogenedentes bacterium ADurb.Bin179]|nr:MAG: hypothetical protein BWY09_03202 [Candidatus Hydrogenedentes bacterium ADurb.Bin179]